MKLNPLIAAVMLAGTLLGAAPSAAAPLTVGALGPVSVTGWGSCPASTTGIDFELNSPDFLLQVGYFPPAGAAAANADCALLVEQWNQFGNLFPEASTPCTLGYHYAMKPDALSISGNTYTVTNSFRHCNGVISNQTTRITIATSTITFSQIYQWTDGYRFETGGTLMRLW